MIDEYMKQNNKPEIHLLAGVPDDGNRDYLPERIKDNKADRIVVNENGNNSQVYPERLKEYHAVLLDEVEDTWYEYVPESYDPAQKTPLVIAMHGGLMTGWGQCIYTSWSMVADREGFIVIFPDASKRRLWITEQPEEYRKTMCTPNGTDFYLNDFPDDYHENHDINLILKIIDLAEEKYNIDPGRIYMQGMSCGNAMTNTIARHYAYKFAGFAGSAGPVSPKLLFDSEGKVENDGGPVDIWQTRMENDGSAPGETCGVEELFRKNREYWNRLNGVSSAPRIMIDGENNYAFYDGPKGNLTYREVVNRDHGQTLDDAELAWDYVFSGARRKEDGAMEHTATELSREGDPDAVAVAAGKSRIWHDNQAIPIEGETFIWNKMKYHGLNGDTIVRGSYIMMPLKSLSSLFGFDYQEKNGEARMETADGRTLCFARGEFVCTVNNRIRDMYVEAVERDHLLYVSAEWFLEDVMGMFIARTGDVVYAARHNVKLSRYFAGLIADLL